MQRKFFKNSAWWGDKITNLEDTLVKDSNQYVTIDSKLDTHSKDNETPKRDEVQLSDNVSNLEIEKVKFPPCGKTHGHI